MSDTYEQLVADVENIVSSLDELVILASGGSSPVSVAEFLDNFGTSLEDHGGDICSAAWSALVNDWPLEVRIVGSRQPGGGEWSVDGAEVVFCTGGPHIKLDTKEQAVLGYWGGYTVRRSIRADVCSFYEDVAEQY